jgi:hypothetical protein
MLFPCNLRIAQKYILIDIMSQMVTKVAILFSLILFSSRLNIPTTFNCFLYEIVRVSVSSTVFFFFLFCATGAWTQGLMFARQVLYYLSYSTNPFLCWWFFFFFSRYGLQTICLGWLRNMILQISASWVARITGVSHPWWLFYCFLNKLLFVKGSFKMCHSNPNTRHRLNEFRLLMLWAPWFF